MFETNIRFVGGLLTLYAFTGDAMYKEKAQEVADKLLPAFQTPTGIPNALVNLRTGVSISSRLLFIILYISLFLFLFFQKNSIVKIMVGLAEEAAFYLNLELYILSLLI